MHALQNAAMLENILLEVCSGREAIPASVCLVACSNPSTEAGMTCNHHQQQLEEDEANFRGTVGLVVAGLPMFMGV